MTINTYHLIDTCFRKHIASWQTLSGEFGWSDKTAKHNFYHYNQVKTLIATAIRYNTEEWEAKLQAILPHDTPTIDLHQTVEKPSATRFRKVKQI